MTQSTVLGVVPTGSGSQVRGDFNTSIQCLATDNYGTTAPSTTYQLMLWRRSTDNALFRRSIDNTAWEILEFFAATNPSVNDDSANGFIQRSLWVNTSAHTLFYCLNNTAGAAVWAEITTGGGGGGGVASVFGRTGSITATAGDYSADKITETSGVKMLTFTERTKLGSINTYWSSRLASDPAVLVKNVSLGQHDLRKLLIFYGIPININAINDADYAAGYLAQYDDVVLGAGLQAPAHANYASTTSIITKTKTLNPNIIIWGYVDIGVNAPGNNYSLGTMQTQIDQWMTAGATGIFLDDAGYDFAVSRARQNSVIDYVHGKNVGAFINAWTIGDVFSSAVNATYNSGGVATHADSRDAYLLESWAINTVAYSGSYALFSDLKTRGDNARTYRSSLGVRMYASHVAPVTGTTTTDFANFLGIAECLAHIWRLNGFGVQSPNYSASGVDTNIVKKPSPKVVSVPGGRLTAAYKVNGASTEVEASDIGVTVHYESGQYTWAAPSAPGGTTTVVSGGGGGTAEGMTATVVQSSNGAAPNAPVVLLKSSVSAVSLLTVASERYQQTFRNATTQTVTFTSSETLDGFPTGFGLPPSQFR